MTTLKLAGFTGEAPRITPRLLPASGAQIARSVRLEDGTLSPFRKPFLEEELSPAPTSTVKTIYRHGTDWLYWTSIVHAVPGPVATDRLYYTGDGVPKMRVGSTVYDLEVPAPTAALTGTPAGVGAGQTYTRLYVYTFVTAYGEESEPCPVSNEVNWQFGQTVTLSGFQSAPGGRNITLQRIYRSQTGTSGGTTLFLIAERAASNTNYVDSIAVDAYGEPLPSLDFNPPPDTLSGLVGMPNGMMAAFVGKDLYFCEPFQPHAWPEKYVLTMDYEITGLGCYENTLVVGTKGNPYVVGGTHPDAMTMQKLELNMPCLNTAGVVDLGYSIVYPSHDGLVKVEGGAATVPSTALFTRDQWLQLDPATMVCGKFYGRFFGSYSYTGLNGLTEQGTIILDLTGDQPFLIRSPHKADAFFYDVASGSLFMAVGDAVYEWDSQMGDNDFYTWRSKAFVLPAPGQFGAILFEVDQGDDQQALLAYEEAVQAVVDANTALFTVPNLGGAIGAAAINSYPINGDALQQLPVGPTASVTIYADKQLHATVTGAGRMQRIKGGKLAREWEIEVSGNIRVIELTLATTAQELRSV